MRDATAPDFSVVIPCRNEVTTLGRCLDALETQDHPARRFEVILVDGGSTDGSAELARRRGHRVLRDGGGGPSLARNEGIRAARAPIIAFTDADCVPRHDWLASLAEVFREHPSAGGVAGALRMPRGTLLGRLEDADATANYRGYITSNVAYRRDALLEVGGFAEDLTCAEDYDLAWRVMDAGWRIVHDARPVVRHEPPELRSLARYLKKQAWYAANDVPAYLRAMRRAREGPDARGSAQATLAAARPAHEALCVLALGAGALLRNPALAGAGLAAAALSAGVRAARSTRAANEPASLAAPAAAMGLARTLVRGAGTLHGVARHAARHGTMELLRPAGRASPWGRAASLPSPSPATSRA